MSMDKIKKAMEAADWQARSIGGVCLQIAEHVPGAADIIAADLDNPEMSLTKCFGALKDYAREHQKGGFWGCACAYWDTENPVIKVVADFYKVPLDGAPRSSHPTAQANAESQAIPEPQRGEHASNRPKSPSGWGGSWRVDGRVPEDDTGNLDLLDLL